MPVICIIREKFHKSALDITVYLIMKTGDIAKASPSITGEADWIEEEVIDVEIIHLRASSSPLRKNISCLRKCNG